MSEILKDDMLVDVFNNGTGVVVYTSEISRVKRRWDLPNAVKKIPLGELKELVNMSGGHQLLSEDLLIKDITVREELSLPILPEHILGQKEVEELLKKPAPTIEKVLENTNETIKEKIAMTAIDTNLTDISKMEVIQEHSGIDVLNAIKEKREEEKEQKTTKTRNKKS